PAGRPRGSGARPPRSGGRGCGRARAASERPPRAAHPARLARRSSGRPFHRATALAREFGPLRRECYPHVPCGPERRPCAGANPCEMTTSPQSPSPHRLSSEVHTAARNAFHLGMSLVATWGVALVVRLWLPRHLGPDRFGLYTFAENFAAMSLGFLSFGIDPYIQKEI